MTEDVLQLRILCLLGETNYIGNLTILKWIYEIQLTRWSHFSLSWWVIVCVRFRPWYDVRFLPETESRLIVV